MERLSFIVVPYLPTGTSFTFADYQFVPLQNLHTYANGSVLEAARVIAGQYFDQVNETIKKVTFVFPLNKKLGDYLDDNIKVQISDMLKVLYLDGFCHIDQLNVVTAENFEAIFSDMLPDNYSLSTRSGGVFPQTIIGMDMKKTSYTTPPHVIINRGNFTPSNLVSPSLAHVVDKQTPSLLNALSFFFEAMRNDDRRTWLNKITDLYMAFLMLMKVSPDEKERELWWKNLAVISELGLPQYPYPVINTQTGKLRAYPEKLNIAQIWGEEFYKLRCKILHGDRLTISDFAFSDISGNSLVSDRPGHFYLGANVFPVLFFYKFRQEHPAYVDAPRLVITDKEDFTSQNYTWLGFGKEDYKLPFYVNDLLQGKVVMKAIRPLP